MPVKTPARLMASLLVAGLAACSGDDGSSADSATSTTPPTGTTTSPTTTEPTVLAVAEDVPIITLAEYELLTDGMTYERVVAIIGGRGLLQYDVEGSDVKLQGYLWQGIRHGFITGQATVSFVNGALSDKSQFGLE